MVAGLGSLGNSDSSMMLKYLDDINSLDAYQKATKTDKNEESSSVEDIFGQIIDEINENMEKIADQQANLTTPLGDNTNSQFGPPAGMEIDGLDVDSLNAVEPISDYGDLNTDNNSSKNIASGQHSGGGAGGNESQDEENSEDDTNPMDLNRDGTVTVQEMLSYIQMQSSAYNQESTSSNSDEALFLMV